MQAACATYVGKTDGSRNAPLDKPKNGSVAYNPYGLSEIVSERREAALSKIVSYCGSKNYTIVKEEKREKGDDTQDSIATIGAKALQYIDFECKDQ